MACASPFCQRQALFGAALTLVLALIGGRHALETEICEADTSCNQGTGRLRKFPLKAIDEASARAMQQYNGQRAVHYMQMAERLVKQTPSTISRSTDAQAKDHSIDLALHAAEVAQKLDTRLAKWALEIGPRQRLLARARSSKAKFGKKEGSKCSLPGDCGKRQGVVVQNLFGTSLGMTTLSQLGVAGTVGKSLAQKASIAYHKFVSELQLHGFPDLPFETSNNLFFAVIRHIEADTGDTSGFSQSGEIRAIRESVRSSLEYKEIRKALPTVCRSYLQKAKVPLALHEQDLEVDDWFAVYPGAASETDRWENPRTHTFHTHPGCVVSGVIYLSNPSPQGPILLADPRGMCPLDPPFPPPDNTTIYGQAPFHRGLEVYPEAGDIIMWPSFMYHTAVPRAVASNDRVVLPFNCMLPKSSSTLLTGSFNVPMRAMDSWDRWVLPSKDAQGWEAAPSKHQLKYLDRLLTMSPTGIIRWHTEAEAALVAALRHANETEWIDGGVLAVSLGLVSLTGQAAHDPVVSNAAQILLRAVQQASDPTTAVQSITHRLQAWRQLENDIGGKAAGFIDAVLEAARSWIAAPPDVPWHQYLEKGTAEAPRMLEVPVLVESFFTSRVVFATSDADSLLEDAVRLSKDDLGLNALMATKEVKKTLRGCTDWHVKHGVAVQGVFCARESQISLEFADPRGRTQPSLFGQVAQHPDGASKAPFHWTARFRCKSIALFPAWLPYRYCSRNESEVTLVYVFTAESAQWMGTEGSKEA